VQSQSCFCSSLFFPYIFCSISICLFLCFSIQDNIFDLPFSNFCSTIQNSTKMADARIFQMSFFQLKLKYCRDFTHATSWPHFIVDLRRQTRTKKKKIQRGKEKEKKTQFFQVLMYSGNITMQKRIWSPKLKCFQYIPYVLLKFMYFLCCKTDSDTLCLYLKVFGWKLGLIFNTYPITKIYCNDKYRIGELIILLIEVTSKLSNHLAF